MTSFSKKLSVMILGGLFCVSCNLKDKMDDMHSGTQSLDNNTKKLVKKTSHVEGMQEDLLMALCQDGTASHRIETIHQMTKATTLTDKFAYAGHYLAAQEFQVCQKFRDTTDLKEDAVTEILRFVSARAPHVSTLSSSEIDLGSADNSIKDLMALSAALHKVNTLQGELSGTEESMLSLLIKGLKVGMMKDMGLLSDADKLPEWQEIILENRSHVIYLLQLRHNTLSALALSSVTDTSVGLPTKAKMMMFGWDAEISNLFIEEIEKFNVYLNASLQTKAILQSLGVKLINDKKLAKFWVAMNDLEARKLPSDERLLELNKKRISFIAAQGVEAQAVALSQSETLELQAEKYNHALKSFEVLVGKVSGRKTKSEREEIMEKARAHSVEAAASSKELLEKFGRK